MNARKNITLVESFLKLTANGSAQELIDMTTDDFSWTVMKSGSSKLIWDRSTYLTVMSSIPELIEGPFRMVPTGWTTQDDRVAVEAEVKAKTRSGRIYDNHYHILFEIRGGKIASGREYMDSLHAEQVFGSTS